jgi:pyruvate dehydrogenase (quinone)
MSKTVGDFLVQRLYQWGVRHMFGYPGDGINGVFGALNRAEEKIQFVQARHEEMTAFMASAYAKFSGNLGVCIATSGPGASHLTTGLYDALMDRQPFLRLSASRRATRWADSTNRNSIWSRCSRMWRAPMSSRRPRLHRCGI